MKGGSLGSNIAHIASTDLQLLMSAFGPKQTSLHRTCPLSGVKRTWVGALRMLALTLRDILLQSYDFVGFGTKRTSEDFDFLPHL